VKEERKKIVKGRCEDHELKFTLQRERKTARKGEKKKNRGKGEKKNGKDRGRRVLGRRKGNGRKKRRSRMGAEEK